MSMAPSSLWTEAGPPGDLALVWIVVVGDDHTRIVFLVIIVIDTTASDPSRQPCQPYPLRYVAVDADLVGVGWIGLTIGY